MKEDRRAGGGGRCPATQELRPLRESSSNPLYNLTKEALLLPHFADVETEALP